MNTDEAREVIALVVGPMDRPLDVAALIEGLRFVGVEHLEHYAAVTAERLRTVDRGFRDDGQQGALDLGGTA